MERKIPPSDVANDLVKALQDNKYEVHIGNIELLYQNFFAGKEGAFTAFNT